MFFGAMTRTPLRRLKADVCRVLLYNPGCVFLSTVPLCYASRAPLSSCAAPSFFSRGAIQRRKKAPLTSGENHTLLVKLFRSLGHVKEDVLLKSWESLCPEIQPDNEVSYAVSIMGCLLLEGTAGEPRIQQRFSEMETAQCHPALVRFLTRLCQLYWDLESLGGKPSTAKWRYAMRLAWRVASEFQIRPDLNSKRPQNTDGFYLMGDEPADILKAFKNNDIPKSAVWIPPTAEQKQADTAVTRTPQRRLRSMNVNKTTEATSQRADTHSNVFFNSKESQQMSVDAYVEQLAKEWEKN